MEMPSVIGHQKFFTFTYLLYHKTGFGSAKTFKTSKPIDAMLPFSTLRPVARCNEAEDAIGASLWNVPR